MKPRNPNLYLYDVESAREIANATIGVSIEALQWAPDGKHFAVGATDWNSNLVAGHEAYTGTSRCFIATWDKPWAPAAIDMTDEEGYQPESVSGPYFLAYGADWRTAAVAVNFAVVMARPFYSTSEPREVVFYPSSRITDKFAASKQGLPIALSRLGTTLVCAQKKLVRWFDVRPLDGAARRPTRLQTLPQNVDWLAMSGENRVLVLTGSTFSILYSS